MKIRTLAIAAAAFLLPLAACACGADSTGELDKGELTEELETTGMPDGAGRVRGRQARSTPTSPRTSSTTSTPARPTCPRTARPRRSPRRSPSA